MHPEHRQPVPDDPHPPSTQIAGADLSALLADLDAGIATSVEVTAALIERIASVDAPGTALSLQSVLALAPDAAEVARQRDEERSRGRRRGPLHGIPILVKDNIEAVGLPRSAGSRALAHRTVVRDAPSIARWSATLRSSHDCATPARSSSVPPTCPSGRTCGHRIPRAAGRPWAASPATRTRWTAARAAPPRVPGPQSPGGWRPQRLRPGLQRGNAAALRVGVVPQWLSGHAATDRLFAEAADALEQHVARVDRVDVSAGDAGVQTLADVVALNVDQLDTELAHFGQEYFERAVASGGRASDAYRGARERNVAWARDTCLGPALDAGFDVLISPAYQPAWKSDLILGDQIGGGGAVCTPPAILGWPILTVPMGLVDGLPVGLAIVGPAGSEPRLLAIGHLLESILGLRACGPAARCDRHGGPRRAADG